MLLPAVTDAGPVFSTATSALVVIVVWTLELLLFGFGSGVSELATAVLLTMVPLAVDGSASTVMVNVAEAPLRSGETEQATVPFWSSPGVAQLPVLPAGRDWPALRKRI